MRTLVLIADDPAVVARMRLATRYAAGVRGIATLDGRESIGAELAALQPDIVVVNEMCQRVNTLARLHEASATGATVLLLVSAHSRSLVEDAFAAGSHAILTRESRAPALGSLIGEIALGRVLLSAQHERDVDRPASGEAPPSATVTHLRLVTDQDARRAGASA